MHESESIDDMLTRFKKIINGLFSLGKYISNDHKVWKIIWSLSKMWKIKATNLKKLNNSKEMNFTTFMGNLKTHVIELKARQEWEPQKEECCIQGFHVKEVI